MAAPKSVITETELSVLKVLWAQGALTARMITEELYSEVNTSSIGTVQKLLARLEEKELVRRDRTESAHRFHANVTREDIAGLQLDEFAGKLSEGSLSPFVLHLLKANKLSKREKQEIRRMLDEL